MTRQDELECALKEAEERLDAVRRAASPARPIATAPRDGTVILVWFRPHGWMSVRAGWERNGEHADIWYVTDQKFEDRPVRGYREGDDAYWMPLPPSPVP